ncbi:MAG: SpvB/TcaC N-terminal domain-containing protein [Propionivibrio sp.]
MDFLYRNGRSCSSVATWFVAYLAVLPLIGNAGPMDIDGQFAVSQTGAATYTIPLQIPPGAGGVEPQLALTYNSQSGNGLLGVGWSLSGLSTITRCPRTMAQDGVRGSVNFDANDRYCLDGQRLMVVSGTDGADGAEYRTEREGFSKIVSYGSAGNGPAWFKVWTKSGQIIEFGDTADSRIEVVKAAGASPAWLIGTVRAWAVNKVSDISGNYYSVTYTEDSTNGDYYPNRIDYTGNANTGLTTNNSVQFEYENRPDITPLSIAGSLIRNSVRLKTIQAQNAAKEIKEYRLKSQISASTGRSEISDFMECDQSNNCLSSTQFFWSIAGVGAPQSVGSIIRTYTGASKWKSTYGIYVGDYDGDGVSDLYLISDTNLHFCKGGADITTPNAIKCTATYTGTSKWKSTFNIYVGDYDGDGISDLYLISDTNLYFCKGGADITTPNAINCIATYSGASKWKSTYGIYVGDYNGDGISDLYLVSDTNLYFCKGGADITTPNAINCIATYSGASKWKSTYGIYVGDYNGDGISDLYLVSDTNLYFCKGGADITTPNAIKCTATYTGTSKWKSTFNIYVGDYDGDGISDLYLISDTNLYFCKGGADITTPNAINCIATYSGASKWKSTYGIYVGDYNGDGISDLYLVSDTNLYFCKGGADITTPNAIKCTATYTGTSKWKSTFNIYVGDYDGSGTNDLYLVSDTNLYFLAGSREKPGYVVSVVSGLGNRYSWEFSPLTASTAYTKGVGATYPIQDLQIPLYVVSSVGQSNGVGGVLTTTYTYGGLKAEVGTGRGLLGFNWIENQQVESGVVTRTTYRQDWPYVGLPSQVKSSLAGSGNNGLLRQIDLSYSCLDPKTGAACSVAAGNRYVPYASQKVESGWDLNGAALPVTTSTQQIDAYGNPTEETVSRSDGYSQTITNSFLNDTARWILGRRLRTQIQSTTP